LQTLKFSEVGGFVSDLARQVRPPQHPVTTGLKDANGNQRILPVANNISTWLIAGFRNPEHVLRSRESITMITKESRFGKRKRELHCLNTILIIWSSA